MVLAVLHKNYSEGICRINETSWTEETKQVWVKETGLEDVGTEKGSSQGPWFCTQ